jgi:hypothetical protein
VWLVGTTTLLLPKRVYAQFMDWLKAQLSEPTWVSACGQPQLQVFFLHSYGNWLFQTGQPLYVFRHLVVFCQQQFPHLRPSMTEAWNLLSRWEILNPVTHRPPAPKLVLMLSCQWLGLGDGLAGVL